MLDTFACHKTTRSKRTGDDFATARKSLSQGEETWSQAQRIRLVADREQAVAALSVASFAFADYIDICFRQTARCTRRLAPQTRGGLSTNASDTSNQIDPM
jgi:hypothetical protein